MRPARSAAFLSAVVVAAFAALPAAAASLISLPGAPDPGPFAGETLVVTFDIANAPGFTWAGAPATRTTSQSGTAAAPAGVTSRFAFVSTAHGQPASATLLTPALRSISLYWGSVDAYNKVTLLGRNNQVLGAFTGNQLSMQNGSWWAAAANRRVGFVADPGEWIHAVRLDASGVAFEFDDIAAGAVPEPAGWAMLITGFGLVGAAQRRREAKIAKAAAI
jgi:hypothetical protein